ncbi:hypothetical protein B0H11DRAFT_2262241 [Mycena galericulata]|nr:hypothetical protein B0H11DRAFT_2262241 [Mycena galericulata]
MAEFVYEKRAQLNAGKGHVSIPAPAVVAPSPSHFLLGFPTFSRSPSRSSLLAPSCFSEDSPFSDDNENNHVISECMGHMVAGTTSISLSYFLWELTRHQDILL